MSLAVSSSTAHGEVRLRPASLPGTPCPVLSITKVSGRVHPPPSTNPKSTGSYTEGLTIPGRFTTPQSSDSSEACWPDNTRNEPSPADTWATTASPTPASGSSNPTNPRRSPQHSRPSASYTVDQTLPSLAVGRGRQRRTGGESSIERLRHLERSPTALLRILHSTTRSIAHSLSWHRSVLPDSRLRR